MNTKKTFNVGVAAAAMAALLSQTGCLGKPPVQPRNWTVAWFADAPERATRPPVASDAPVARLSQIDVRAPYNTTRIAVLRPDGSLAFDSCNVFAAVPTSLLRGPLADALERSGRFSVIVHGGSSAATPLVIEAAVERIALDCAHAGRRDAVVEATLVLLRNRSVVATAGGHAAVPTADGNFTAAFSQAFSRAIEDAAVHLTETKHP